MDSTPVPGKWIAYINDYIKGKSEKKETLKFTRTISGKGSEDIQRKHESSYNTKLSNEATTIKQPSQQQPKQDQNQETSKIQSSKTQLDRMRSEDNINNPEGCIKREKTKIHVKVGKVPDYFQPLSPRRGRSNFHLPYNRSSNPNEGDVDLKIGRDTVASMDNEIRQVFIDEFSRMHFEDISNVKEVFIICFVFFSNQALFIQPI